MLVFVDVSISESEGNPDAGGVKIRASGVLLAAALMIGLLHLFRGRAAALISMGGALGMMTPPAVIPAMNIGGGIDLPFTGFALPLFGAVSAFNSTSVLAPV